MAMLRMVRRALVFGTRSRLRFLIFALIFTILSGSTILLMSGFESFDKQDLLKHRGVVVSASDWDVITENDAKSLINDVVGSSDNVETMVIRYINFGNTRIFGVDPHLQWANPDVSPTRIVDGGYLSSSGEAIVSDTFLIPSTNALNGYQLYVDASVGDLLPISSDITRTLEDGTNGMIFKVVGEFKTTGAILADLTNNARQWMIISNEDLTKLIADLGIPETETFVRHVVFIAQGPLIIDSSPYDTVDSIGRRVTEATQGNTNWQSPVYTPKADKIDEKNLRFLALAAGFIGTLIVATMYSYLISRFRRMEVAILKAIGYQRKHVVTFLLGEILAVSVLGFIVGLTIVQLWLIFNRESAYIQWILLSPLSAMSFLAVVILSIPGFLLLSTRSFKVRPIEIFRQK